MAVVAARTEATIRSLGDPEPIPVSWHLTDDPGLMDHPRLIGHQPLTFTATGDRIPRLAENFRALRRRRLVITGGPGSGKTTLAVQLLLRLAWEPDQARHYLAYLARQLTAHGTRDLAWWHLADLTATPAQRRRTARVCGLVGGLAVGLAVASLRGLVTGLREGLGAGFGYIRAIGGVRPVRVRSCRRRRIPG
ncbi:hypothetical protein [Microbispora sp. H10670]|uniref:hypothetical protein n=1 Tax=Microbispora sp. H10670 TaxID=2729108 RepID=UPI001601C4F4|nr:hypothetical protein [Microbispora sp. H10670]